jgi:solute carrier family 13 (sodium-dependent dicarboxylate transporter), member 2/3/5
MRAQRIGFWLGLAAFALTLLVEPPQGMSSAAWNTAGLVVWMATWWMTEALPLYATAILPFLVLPMIGVADANAAAAAYYSPVIFLFIGGAFLALSIERTGLHRRLALAILGRSGDTSWRLLLAVMAATALLSAINSNTSTALIMMPMALAMLAAGNIEPGRTTGIAGPLPMGISFAASIGGLGTLVGSPTNAISAALIERSLGVRIGFAEWMLYGMPVVVLAIPLAAFIIARVHRLHEDRFDPIAARTAIASTSTWTTPERRLVPIVALALATWMAQPFIEPFFPEGAITDGTIAAFFGLLLFVLPDGTGRPMLVWKEANRAPWDVVLMYGGGLALAVGMTQSGLAGWMGERMLPLAAVPLPVIAIVIVGFVILVTEFASNVATASAIMPVIAALVGALGADPILLALPAAMASSWGFMLPAGSAPNAIAWATGHIALPKVIRAGLVLDIAGIFLLVGVIWSIAALR